MSKEFEIKLNNNLSDQTHQYNAIEVEWIKSNTNTELLDSHPKINNSYFVKLKSPITIKKGDFFWAIYLNPLSMLNGIENENDIQEIRFYKCYINETIEVNKTHTIIKINVNQIKLLDELPEIFTPNNEWKILIEYRDTLKKHGTIKNFNMYSYLSVNIESDLGVDLIIKKEHNKSRIVAINQWGFDRNEWLLCKIPLNTQDEIKYGIEHI